LVHLDPPFHSAASCNVLFRAPDGSSSSESWLEAFNDSWRWGDLSRSGSFRMCCLHRPQAVPQDHGQDRGRVDVRLHGDAERLPPLGPQEGFRRARRERGAAPGEQAGFDL
jgi:hypothetical protein